MKKTAITLVAAALALGAPLTVFAQEQDPNAPPIVVPDEQSPPQADQSGKKRKKREQSGERQESTPQEGEDQGGQSFKKWKKRDQAEQPQEQFQQPGEEQTGQPSRKRKKRDQAEQPQEQFQQPGEDQTGQPSRKRKKRDQAEQPQEQFQQPGEDQTGQPSRKRKKPEQAEQAEQPQEQLQQPGEEQTDQPAKKKKKEQAEQPGDQTQPSSRQTTGQPQPGQPAAGEVPSEVSEYLSDTRSMKQLSDEELAQRVRAGRDLSRMKGLPDDVRRRLAAEGRKARAEALARGQGTADKGGQQQPGQGEGQAAQPTQANPDKKQVRQLDGNKSSPDAESKARTYLDDRRSADQLDDGQLRDRLEGMRELMAGNRLSGESERALRRKLRTEREILRNRVARKVVVEETQDNKRPDWQRRRDDSRWNKWAERDVLSDRRRSDELEEGELRRRIDIYREAVDDNRYSDGERSRWRGMMERDRRYLRDRMVGDRRERERYWHDQRDRNGIDIGINIVLGQDREPPEAVFMDEIDDEELETYLVAAPRRKIARRYTVEEIEEEPELRAAMPAIEIDNIHFGFNESFVREEEVDKLDRIAEVIERILAAHPGEVFMIAGHTDAVGSDAYNLRLSRERAEAVKKALTAYYVIPARNLKTAGYGERYLKIPTSDAEEENRRVSLQRVTPLVGEADEVE
ncbi:MAG: OmpA family protein [Parvibaculaceae bacterium]